MSKKPALGRGLGALIRTPEGGSILQSLPSAAVYELEPGERVQSLPIHRILPGEYQPRKRFPEEAIMELMDSIREHGVIQPLIVRPRGEKFELIAGERRFRACQMLHLDEVPAIVRETSDKDALEMALVENLQREDLNPMEESEAYVRLANEFGLRQEDVAKRVGKSRASVANSMRLLDLEPSVQTLVSQGALSTGHAKVILALKNPDEQRMVADMIVRQKLTVRDTEKAVNRQLGNTPETGGTKSTKVGSKSQRDGQVPAYLLDLEDRLRNRFSTSVSITHSDKKGKIEIEYFGNEELDRILELLGIDLNL